MGRGLRLRSVATLGGGSGIEDGCGGVGGGGRGGGARGDGASALCTTHIGCVYRYVQHALPRVYHRVAQSSQDTNVHCGADLTARDRGTALSTIKLKPLLPIDFSAVTSRVLYYYTA